MLDFRNHLPRQGWPAAELRARATPPKSTSGAEGTGSPASGATALVLRLLTSFTLAITGAVLPLLAVIYAPEAGGDYSASPKLAIAWGGASFAIVVLAMRGMVPDRIGNVTLAAAPVGLAGLIVALMVLQPSQLQPL